MTGVLFSLLAAAALARLGAFAGGLTARPEFASVPVYAWGGAALIAAALAAAGISGRDSGRRAR